MVQSIWSFFVGPKKSGTKFFKNKAIVPKKKKFGPFFLLLPTLIDIEYSFVRLHKVSWQLWCKLWDHFFGSLRGCLKHIVFWKKAIFSVKKCICPVCFRKFECKKLQETIYKIRKVFLTISVEVIGFFKDLKCCWKHNLLKKKATFKWTNVFALCFLKVSSVTNLRKRLIGAKKIFWQLLW